MFSPDFAISLSALSAADAALVCVRLFVCVLALFVI